MNDTEKEQLVTELMTAWPEKFTEADLQYWCKELDQYQLPDVSIALVRHKNTKKWSPKLPEILELLPALPSGEKHAALRQRRSFTAQTIVRENPHLAEWSDEQLIVVAHRHCWVKIFKEYQMAARYNGGKLHPNQQQRLLDQQRITAEQCTRELWFENSPSSKMINEAICQALFCEQMEFRERLEKIGDMIDAERAGAMKLAFETTVNGISQIAAAV